MKFVIAALVGFFCMSVSSGLHFGKRGASVSTESGKSCVFPFEYKGTTYTDSCAPGNKGWCYTDAAQKDWDYCVAGGASQSSANIPAPFNSLESDPRPVPAGCKLNPTKITEAQKKEIIDYHNEIRAAEPAAFMLKMQWSEQLAGRAQYFTDLCPEDHAENTNCYGEEVGQNLIVSKTLNSYKEVDIKRNIITLWSNNEKVSYDLASNKCKAGAVCGHFTQVAWARSFQVGCGVTQCKKEGDPWPLRTIFACNYMFQGNMNGNPPYKKGDHCSDCANGLYPLDYKCVDGAFCAPCAPNDSSCTKQDVCRDTDPDGNCAMVGPMLCTSTESLKQSPELYAAMMQNCRKTCNLCNE